MDHFKLLVGSAPAYAEAKLDTLTEKAADQKPVMPGLQGQKRDIILTVPGIVTFQSPDPIIHQKL